jgi:hypothetical protein
MDPRRYYTPYIRDMNYREYKRAQKPWIVYRILGVFLVIGMVCAAFVTSPWMGVPMVLVMLAGGFRKK